MREERSGCAAPVVATAGEAPPLPLLDAGLRGSGAVRRAPQLHHVPFATRGYHWPSSSPNSSHCKITTQGSGGCSTCVAPSQTGAPSPRPNSEGIFWSQSSKEPSAATWVQPVVSAASWGRQPRVGNFHSGDACLGWRFFVACCGEFAFVACASFPPLVAASPYVGCLWPCGHAPRGNACDPPLWNERRFLLPQWCPPPPPKTILLRKDLAACASLRKATARSCHPPWSPACRADLYRNRNEDACLTKITHCNSYLMTPCFYIGTLSCSIYNQNEKGQRKQPRQTCRRVINAAEAFQSPHLKCLTVRVSASKSNSTLDTTSILPIGDIVVSE